MDSKQIGAFIAQRRKSLNLTQQELADKLAVTNKAISKWECGDGFPDITSIPALANALQVSSDDLLSGVVNGKEYPLREMIPLDHVEHPEPVVIHPPQEMAIIRANQAIKIFRYVNLLALLIGIFPIAWFYSPLAVLYRQDMYNFNYFLITYFGALIWFAGHYLLKKNIAHYKEFYPDSICTVSTFTRNKPYIALWVFLWPTVYAIVQFLLSSLLMALKFIGGHVNVYNAWQGASLITAILLIVGSWLFSRFRKKRKESKVVSDKELV